MNAACTEFTIAKIGCKPGDTLVVKSDMRGMPLDTVERARAYFRASLPEGVNVLLVDSQTELSIISKSDYVAPDTDAA